MSQKPRWTGLFVALPTPFSEGRVDGAALARHIEYVLANGVTGIVPCGTTGEAVTLSREEKREVIATAVKVARGRVPVVAGVGTNNTADTLHYAEDALEAGADGLLVVTPYYNKPPQDGLYAHFRAVAEATRAPIVVYNVPGRTGVNLTPATLAQLSELPEIVAVKDATADLRVAASNLALCGDRLTYLSGDDFTTLAYLGVGGHGAISVTGNVAPALMSQMIHAALEGDWSTAQRLNLALLPLHEALFETSNPIPVKAAVSLLGFGSAEPRLPLVRLGEKATRHLSDVLRSLGLPA
jgi:4-hydroxy-tetrahydrodipicolinate synthase